MPPVRGPPVLRISHQRRQVFFQRSIVELLELAFVVKARLHRVGRRRMLVQDGEVELVGPPIAIGPCALSRARALRGVERTLGFG